MTELDPTTARLLKTFAINRHGQWSPAHLANVLRTLGHVARFLADEHETTLLDAEPDELKTFLNARLDVVAANTVIGDHTYLKAFYRWATEDPGDGRPLRAINPMLRVRPPKGEDPDPDRTPEVTPEQYRALLATCHAKAKRPGRGGKIVNDRRDAAMLAVLWATGIRRSELAALEYRHLDWDTGMLHLAKTKGRGRTRSRDVLLDSEALERLMLYVHERGDHDGPLFETTHVDPATRRRAGVKPNTITLMIRRRCVLAGIGTEHATAHFGAHAFRRTFSSDWLAAGGSVTALETHNGWKHDGRMAARYTRARESQLAAAEAQRVHDARRGGRHLRAVGEL